MNNKYRVVVNFKGTLNFEIEARNKNEADITAKAEYLHLSDTEFLEKLNLQHIGTLVEEIT